MKNILLEIIKNILPALLVALTVYFVIRQYFNHQIAFQHVAENKEKQKEGKAFKLQTYERLALFCERISIPNLIMRLKSSSMSATDLQTSMLISIQKEYEHNVAQQIYISEKLWQIIEFAKNNMLTIIADTPITGDINEYEKALMLAYTRQNINAINTAISAIRRETQLLL